MDYAARIELVKSRLLGDEVDALLLTSVPNIIYLTGYTGFSPLEREAFILITKHEQYVLTDGRYTQAISTLVPHFKLLEVRANYPYEYAWRELIKKHSIKKVGIEEDNLTAYEYRKLSRLTNTIHTSFAHIRWLKEASELDLLKKACRLTDQTFDYILEVIKPGITEQDIALEMELFVRKHGAKFSFDPIIAFNAHAAMPHYLTGTDVLPDSAGQLILMDFGVQIQNYCSDMTRVVFLGTPSDEYTRMYNAVYTAQKKALDFLKENKRPKGQDVDAVTREHITAAGFTPYNHGLGHGIGLEVHEAPRLSPSSTDSLVPGMVFTVEPGIYIPEVGGVRIEDDVLITDDGLEILTQSPRKMLVL